MSSPRTRDFYKELAGSIRSERVLQQQKREATAVELRALEGRLYRLQMWEEICKNIERLRIWEERCTQDYACSMV
jgi:hypothetical protein